MSAPALRIGIVAGEPSGDHLGAGLMRYLNSRHENIEFQGIGGSAMRREGCDTLYDMASIELMGLDGALPKLVRILRIRSELGKRFVRNPPNLFIGVDVPDFNIRLEARLKAAGIPTVHYVSPTIWAWRGYRIHKIKRAVTHMLTLFPFEARYYEDRQIPVTCVGHPVADEIGEPDRCRARRQIGIAEAATTIAVLPGSRDSEIHALTPPFVAAMHRIHARYPAVHFVIPLASDRVRRRFLAVANRLHELPVTLLAGQARTAMEAADMVVLASGTAALEAALLRRPHIVAYRVSTLTYRIFKLLKHVNYYSMTNHLLGKAVVPELIQDAVSLGNIAAAVDDWLTHPQKMTEISDQLSTIALQLRLDTNVTAGQVIESYLQNSSARAIPTARSCI